MGSRRVHRMLLVVAAALCISGVLVAHALDWLRRPELTTVDERFDIRGTQAPPGDVVFVKIDDETFNDLRNEGETFPFRRRLHAQAITHLLKAGASVVAYDVQFTEESGSVEDDNALFEAVRSGKGKVVLATTEVGPGGTTAIFGGGEPLEASRAVPSNSNYEVDPGGVVRRVAGKTDSLTTFALAAARVHAGRDVRPPPGTIAEDSEWIDFAGPPGTVRSLRFSRVAAGRFEPGAVTGKVAVVGASAPVLQDLHRTPTTDAALMPGPEIHSNAIATVLDDYPLRSGPGWLNYVLIVVLGAIAPLAARRTSTVRALLLSLAALGAFLAGAQLAFQSGTIVAVAAPVLALGLTTATMVVLTAVTAAFEREQVRMVFSRFVPEAVVGQVLEQADGARLGGVRQEATVLFSDLRGFTSFAENREPDEVISILNSYLTRMSDAILDEGGTLVAYMGDGIMAVFGAPIVSGDHADRAVTAGRRMLEAMDEFNEQMRADGISDQGFKMGVGLNTGWVMSGNVGSDRRLEYTVIGDTTNTAARLEGMTKGTPNQLYMADSTREKLSSEPHDLERVGELEVRGRSAKIGLWTLADTKVE